MNSFLLSNLIYFILISIYLFICELVTIKIQKYYKLESIILKKVDEVNCLIIELDMYALQFQYPIRLQEALC